MIDTVVQVGGGDKPGKKFPWKFALLVAAVVVLAGGAGLGLRWWQSSKDNGQDRQNTPSGLPKVVDDIQNLRDTADEKDVDAAIDTALADPKTNDETRYLLYIQQGHTALQHQDWQAAIEAYGRAQAIKETNEVAARLGDSYAGAGDKAKAIEFYRKAINLVPENNPVRGDQQKEYELKIQELGG